MGGLRRGTGTHCIAGCIHIFNKQTAAHRLALAARNMIYAEKLVFAGPSLHIALPNTIIAFV